MSVSEKLKAAELLTGLRARAGLSKAFMARQLGYKQTSGYSYYEDPGLYRKDHLPPDMVQRLLSVLVGLGDPPISHDDVMAMALNLQGVPDWRIGGEATPAPQVPEMSTKATRPGHLFLDLKQEITTAQFLAIMKLLHEDE